MNLQRKRIPLYLHDAEYAREHEEYDSYVNSHKENIACKEAIDKSLANHYANNRLDAQAVINELESRFSRERILYVLANTVHFHDWDGRFSSSNRKWANTIKIIPHPDSWGGDRVCYFVVEAHSVITDMLITAYRDYIQNKNK